METRVLKTLEAHCTEIDLDACVTTIQKMQGELEASPINHEKLSELSEELLSRLVDQTSQRHFYSLNLAEVDYYNHPRKGWEAIIGRFPDMVRDVEEARKCFALSRCAAAVFHSLQVVEIGLIELGTFIKVTDPKSGWTAVTWRLDKILKTEYAQLIDFERRNRDFLEQVQGTTEALKNVA